jgi:hypothetical protein
MWLHQNLLMFLLDAKLEVLLKYNLSRSILWMQSLGVVHGGKFYVFGGSGPRILLRLGPNSNGETAIAIPLSIYIVTEKPEAVVVLSQHHLEQQVLVLFI